MKAAPSDPFAPGTDVARRATLVGAVLAAVEDVQCREATELEPPEDRQVRSARRPHPDGLMLPPRLIRGRAASGERRVVRRDTALLGHEPGVVVLDFVVVPRDDERRDRVGLLQLRVLLVARVTQPVVGEIDGEVGELLAERDRVLVDVVAQMGHDIRGRGGDVGVRGEGAVVHALARHLGDRQLTAARVARRCGAGARRLGRGPATSKPVPVLTTGLQAPNVDVHGVGVSGSGGGVALADDATHAGVGRDFPAHPCRARAHTSGGIAQIPGQASPQHDAVRQRVARRHAEQER